MNEVPVALAFLAGLLTFLSPCLLPILPAYLGYLSGASVTGQSASRREMLSHAALFVLGFSVVLVAMGASLGLMGGLAGSYTDWLRRAGGLIVVVLGLQMTGLLRLDLLSRDWRVHPGKRLGPGHATSFVTGLFFSLGWTPCVGPTLGAILVLASNTTTVWQGAGLLAVYSLGLGVPFLALALVLDSTGGWIRRLNRYGNMVSWVSGAILVMLGILLFTDQLSRLSVMLGGWVPFGL